MNITMTDDMWISFLEINHQIPADTWKKYKIHFDSNFLYIPYFDPEGNVIYEKKRKLPFYKGSNKYLYPEGSFITLYPHNLLSKYKQVVLTEGELDALTLISLKLPGLTTGGVTSFTERLVPYLKDKKVYICFDNDSMGKKHALRVANMLSTVGIEVCIVHLPEVERCKDIGDYFRLGYTREQFIKLCKNGEKVQKEKADNLQIDNKIEKTAIDISKFKPLSSSQIIEILGSTIKRDDTNKLLTFLAQISAYTDDAQFNISFNAPSSSGKSYIPLEVSTLFPNEDLIKLGNCSPTAFYHEQGEYDKENNLIKVDLSRKIIIFLDQPNSALLERLRSLLSHDEKIIYSKITDKSQKGGNRTKTVAMIGYPTVIFCTASLNFDEQESTRFMLLSPELSQEKLRESIIAKIEKSSNYEDYLNRLEDDKERNLLKLRIRAIKQEHITSVIISNPKTIVEKFFGRFKKLKPRHQRDISRIMNLTKIFALINLWFRDRKDSQIIAIEQDIEEAFKIWDLISESQELNLPPYVLNLFKDVIIPLYGLKNLTSEGLSITRIGLSKQDIAQKHYTVYNRFLPDWQLRQQVLPLLETAGLIVQEADPGDKRKMLIYPTPQFTTFSFQNNSETTSGVSDEKLTQTELNYLDEGDREDNDED